MYNFIIESVSSILLCIVILIDRTKKNEKSPLDDLFNFSVWIERSIKVTCRSYILL